MIKKLRIKFICVIMTVAAVMLGGILGTVIHFTARSMEMESVSMMRSIADRPFQHGSLGKNGADIRLPFFTVQIGGRGELVSLGGGYFDLSDMDDIREIVDAALAADRDSGKLPDRGLRYLKTEAPQGLTIVFADTSSEAATLRNMVWLCVLIFLGALAIFAGISILLSRWAIRPVEKAWEQQRQFVADASHELKTPLSVILANAELLHNGDAAAGERERFSGNILEMSYRMRTLVEELLELARVDSGRLDKGFGALDFSELVQDAALSVQLLYEEKGLSLTCRVEEDIWLRGSRQHLYQLLDVLLDNARKYAEDGGTVRVELVKNGHSCLLTVANPGAPMDRAELQAIFKRFYRGDKARTMNGGYGLGLSIAQSVVQAHRGRIWAESAGGENLFRVQLAVMPGKRLPETEAPEV